MIKENSSIKFEILKDLLFHNFYCWSLEILFYIRLLIKIES
jgi:hypothetical protein